MYIDVLVLKKNTILLKLEKKTTRKIETFQALQRLNHVIIITFTAERVHDKSDSNLTIKTQLFV